MMAYVFTIGCSCGGTMTQLQLEDPVMLTEDKIMVIYGICSKCGCKVRWQKSLYELLLLCPSTKNATTQ